MPLKIVLVEDHQNLRLALEHLLKEEGFDVIALECAEDFDDMYDAHLADAYVIDLNLPGEDGLSLVRRLRQAEVSANIIITTARSEIDERVDGYQAGADVYLQKPVDPAELIAILNSRLDRKLLTESGFSLDVKKQVLLAPSASTSLSVSDVRVLCGFVAAKHHRLEQWQVIEYYQSGNQSMTIANLQMRLSRLRKKMHDIGIVGDVIKSERNIGYILCVDIRII